MREGVASFGRGIRPIGKIANFRNAFVAAPRIHAAARFGGQLRVHAPDSFELIFFELLEVHEHVVRAGEMRSNSSSLICSASASRFCVLWIRNTIRKVTIVVPVLIMSCQVSLQWKIGPVTAQTTMDEDGYT